MRRAVPFWLLVILLAVHCSAYAHPGGLNSQGCHNNRRSGGYHCHRSSYTPSHSSTPHLSWEERERRREAKQKRKERAEARREELQAKRVERQIIQQAHTVEGLFAKELALLRKERKAITHDLRQHLRDEAKREKQAETQASRHATRRARHVGHIAIERGKAIERGNP